MGRRIVAIEGADTRDGASLIEFESGQFEQSSALAVALAQYAALKAEQLERIRYREHLIYLMIFSSGAVLAFALHAAQQATAVLVLPLLGFLFGWPYVIADRATSRVGEFLRTAVEPELADMVDHGRERRMLSWEFRHPSDQFYRLQKRVTWAYEMLLFAVLPASATIVFFLAQRRDALDWFVGVVGWLLSAAIASFLLSTLRDRARQPERAAK
jgi:hypothetical protein